MTKTRVPKVSLPPASGAVRISKAEENARALEQALMTYGLVEFLEEDISDLLDDAEWTEQEQAEGRSIKLVSRDADVNGDLYIADSPLDGLYSTLEDRLVLMRLEKWIIEQIEAAGYRAKILQTDFPDRRTWQDRVLIIRLPEQPSTVG